MNEAHALVFAVAHEVGNHLGAIRLQAHLLDEDLDARALAVASVEIDDLAGRAGPLLALLRPILSPQIEVRPGSSWSALMGGLIAQLEDEGTRGIRVEMNASDGALESAPGVDWLHSLLLAIVGATIPIVPKGGRIALSLAPRGTETALMIEDDGAEEDLSEDSALRGRPLAISIARSMLARLGGRVEWNRSSGETCVELIFPVAAPAGS